MPARKPILPSEASFFALLDHLSREEDLEFFRCSLRETAQYLIRRDASCRKLKPKSLYPLIRAYRKARPELDCRVFAFEFEEDTPGKEWN